MKTPFIPLSRGNHMHRVMDVLAELLVGILIRRLRDVG